MTEYQNIETLENQSASQQAESFAEAPFVNSTSTSSLPNEYPENDLGHSSLPKAQKLPSTTEDKNPFLTHVPTQAESNHSQDGSGYGKLANGEGKTVQESTSENLNNLPNYPSIDVPNSEQPSEFSNTNSLENGGTTALGAGSTTEEQVPHDQGYSSMGDMSNSVKSGAQSPDSQPCDPKDTAAFAHLSSKDSNKDSKNPESNHYQPQGQSVSASNYVGSYFQPQGQSVSSSNYGGDYNQPQGRPVSAQYYGGGYSQPQGQSVSSPIYGGENENKAPGQSPPFSPGQRTHENPAYPSEDNNSFSQNISQTSSAANSNPEVSPEISSGRLKEEHKPAGTANPYPKALVPSSDAEAQTGESNVLNSYNHPKEDFSWSNAGGSGNKLGSAENKGSRDSSNSYSGISATGSSNKYVNSGDTHLSAYGSSTLNLGNNSSLVAPAAFNSPGQSNSANLSGSKTALETPKHSQSPFLNSTNSASLNHTTPPSLNLTNNSIHSPISSSTVRQVGIPGNGTAPITSGIPINGSASEPVQHAHLKKVCKVMGFSITGGVAAFLVLAAVTTFFRRRALKKRNLKAEISVPRLQPSVNGIEVSETGIADTTKNSMQELASEVRSQNHGSVELGRGNYGHHASYASSFGNSDETDLEQNYYLEDQSDRHDDLVYELNIDRPMPEAYEYDTGLELAENDIGYNILDANFEFLNEEPFPQHFERNFDDMTQVQTEYSNDDSVFEGNRR